ncbi:uncharacterized protein PSANT_05740 [Moesziomyces antarcticus]|uniref:Uncharacterized protein n=1 Tax=Pseudozyma antarctica TaxID=84753 RepID=A0A5C3FUS1_PSEA2|nr:uncharacterized protein PSANT_05740 [Moesziomyces antarcticus]
MAISRAEKIQQRAQKTAATKYAKRSTKALILGDGVTLTRSVKACAFSSAASRLSWVATQALASWTTTASRHDPIASHACCISSGITSGLGLTLRTKI